MFNSIKISLVAIVLSLFIIPSSSLAQVTDVDTSGGGTSSCIVINNNLSYKNRASNNKGDVLALQDFLSNRGYLNDSSVTGFFGKATENAVIAFQKDNRLVANPAGFVGFGTRAVIQRMSCGGTTTISISPTTPSGLPYGCSSASGFSSSTGVSCSIGVTTNTVCHSEQYLENGVCKDITKRCPDGSVIPAMLRCGTAVATTSPVSLKIVSGSTSTGKIDVELNLTKNHEGKFVVFIVNPINVATPVSSGDLMTSVYYYNNAFPGPFRVTLDTTKAHQGFATNQGGVHWFNLPSGKYELSAVVYSNNPFKSGTDMEYVDMNVLQAIPYEVVRGEEFDFVGTPSVPVTSINPILNFRTPPTLSLKYDSVGKESLLVGTAVIKVTAGSQPLNAGDIAGCPIVINKGLDGYSYNNAYPVQSISMRYTVTDDSGKIVPYDQVALIQTHQSKIFTCTVSVPTKELFAGKYVLTTRDWNYGSQSLSASTFINAKASNPITVVGETSPYLTSATSDANGNVVVTGQRLNLSGNYLQIDGIGNSMVSKFGPSATSFKFDSKAYGLVKGFHTVTITNTQTGNSNSTGFILENTTNSSVSAVVTSGPSVKLAYDSYYKESALLADAVVVVTAGDSDIRVMKPGTIWPTNGAEPYVYFALDVESTRTNAGSVDSNLVVSSQMASMYSNDSYWLIPAGKSGEFKLTQKFNVKRMFAGSYHAVPHVYAVNSQGTSHILSSKDGNYVTIVGETSPYISSVESDVHGTVIVLGQRLNLPGNYLQIDGMGNSMVSKFNPTATGFKFDSKNYNLEKGSHVLRITNAQTGDSNDARLDITTSPVNPSPVCTADAYQCADGTWVGRSGSNCQFVCPTSPSTPTPSLIANPSSGALSSTYQGQTTSPTMWVDFTVKNYTPRGGEIIKFGDGTESALGYGSSTNARHDYHTAGTYTVKLVLPMHEEYVNQTFTLMAEQLIASTMVTVLPEVVIKGTYMGYLGGSQTPFITTQNIAKADALANCKLNQTSNPTKSIRCTWNGIEIYTFTPTSPTPTVTVAWTPSTITSGSPATLTWSSTNASYCNVSHPGGINPWNNAPTSHTAPYTSVTANDTTTITCYNQAGQSASKTVTLTVNPEPIIPPVVLKGTYMGYLGGSQTPFITTRNITKADALANCKLNQTSNPTKSIRCTWNGTEIYTATPTPVATSTSSNFQVFVNGNISLNNILSFAVKADALAKCKLVVSQYSTSDVRCVWNNQTLLEYSSTSQTAPYGKYQVYFSGVLSQTSLPITKDEAYDNCKLTMSYNPNTQIRCLWNGVIITVPNTCPAPGVMVNGVCTNDGDANPGDVGGGSGGNEGGVLGVYTSAMCTNLPINLHRGMEKPSVSLLQSFLLEKGLLEGEATGFYGDKTVEAVKDYQASKGLPLTGMVYDFTREAIRAESCQ